ncbi:type II R/M system DNA methylase [Spiroplasma citri]|nr:type II R/M system DNA methylase [Spiroplasma citri]
MLRQKSFNENQIIKRINEWELKYLQTKEKEINLDKINQDLRIYYSDINLKQMLFIKKHMVKIL